MEAQGEKLLQNLVDEEQSLLSKVEDAKREAARIVEAAQQKAAAILGAARSRADETAREVAAVAQRDSDGARQEVLASAGREVAETEAKAQKNHQRAVEFVVERELP